MFCSHLPSMYDVHSPYADGPEQQITGFYTSRPGVKGRLAVVRRCNALSAPYQFSRLTDLPLRAMCFICRLSVRLCPLVVVLAAGGSSA